jgi:hypothetical protein
MRDWSIDITLHWPHNRCALGWQYLAPTDVVHWHTAEIFLFVVTITANIEA